MKVTLCRRNFSRHTLPLVRLRYISSSSITQIFFNNSYHNKQNWIYYHFSNIFLLHIEATNEITAQKIILKTEEFWNLNKNLRVDKLLGGALMEGAKHYKNMRTSFYVGASDDIAKRLSRVACWSSYVLRSKRLSILRPFGVRLFSILFLHNRKRL